MFTTRNWVQLGLVVAALLVFSPRSLGQTCSCSADDGKRHYCTADSPGRIRLRNSVANLPARKATVGDLVAGAFGWTTAAGLILR